MRGQSGASRQRVAPCRALHSGGRTGPVRRVQRGVGVKIIAQATIVSAGTGNKFPLVIRLRENEILYDCGNSAISNHFNVCDLTRIYEGQSNQEIVDATKAALKYQIPDGMTQIKIAHFTQGFRGSYSLART